MTDVATAQQLASLLSHRCLRGDLFLPLRGDVRWRDVGRLVRRHQWTPQRRASWALRPRARFGRLSLVLELPAPEVVFWAGRAHRAGPAEEGRWLVCVAGGPGSGAWRGLRVIAFAVFSQGGPETGPWLHLGSQTWSFARDGRFQDRTRTWVCAERDPSQEIDEPRSLGPAEHTEYVVDLLLRSGVVDGLESA